MATAAIGDLPVLALELTEDVGGAWIARVELDEGTLADPPVLDVAGVQWTGTAWTSGSYAGKLRAVLVGGAGGLATELDAKSYRGAAYGAILADILSAAGETLASSSTDLSASVAPAWTRSQGRADQALDELAAALGLTWRVLRDGTIWLGTHDWADSSVDYVLRSRDAGQRIDRIQPTTPAVEPGQSLDGHRVQHVLTTLGEHGLEQEVWWTDGDAESDTIAAVMGRWADRTIGRRLDYLALYPATVATQAADGTLHLIPDDARIRGKGITPVRLRTGIPGCTVKVQSGARVLLGFDAGDPTRPYAALWDGAYLDELTVTAVTKVTVSAPEIDLDPGTTLKLAGGTQPIARVGDAVASGAIAPPGNPKVLA